MTNKIPTMITLLEASRLSGLSYDFLRRSCLDGTLVHIRSGRKILINADKLAEYLNCGGASICEAQEHGNEYCYSQEGGIDG